MGKRPWPHPRRCSEAPGLSVSFTALHSLVIVHVLAIAFLFSGANESPDIGQIELNSEEQAWIAIAETLKSQPDDYVPLCSPSGVDKILHMHIYQIWRYSLVSDILR